MEAVGERKHYSKSTPNSPKHAQYGCRVRVRYKQVRVVFLL